MKTLASPNRDKGKALGLSLADLHRSLDGTLMVHHIAEPLETCAPNDDAKTVRQRMEDKNFDVMGVKENGIIRGYVRRKDLIAERSKISINPFDHSDVIASTTPLVEALPILRVRAYLFILDRTKMTSLVTRADLQKSPVRMLLFGLVSLLEMYLLAMVRICFPGDSFQDKLSFDRLRKVRKLLGDRTDRDEEIDLADCLQLSDKYDLLVYLPGFLDFFRLGEADSAIKGFKKMEGLRNKLAHGQDLVIGTTWEEIIEVAAKIEAFLRDCDEKRERFTRQFSRSEG